MEKNQMKFDTRCVACSGTGKIVVSNGGTNVIEKNCAQCNGTGTKRKITEVYGDAKPSNVQLIFD